MKSLFKGFRKSTTDLSEWSKNDEKLMKAVEGNDLKKVDELLRKKSLNPTKLGPKGLSVFHVACGIGLGDVVNVLIQHGAEVNVLSIQGNTSVQIAARDGHPKLLEKLIELGGVIDHKDGMSLTALHHACVYGKIQCVQCLLKHGADPNLCDRTGKPPLFYAAYSEDLAICKELVDKGANVNLHDEKQLTSLMAAAKKGSVEVCEFLLKKGADPKFTDTAGHSALQYGLDAGFDNLRDVFSRAPQTAAWSVNQQGETTAAAGTPKLQELAQNNEKPVPEVVVQKPDQSDSVELTEDKENLVAEFVPEATPELAHKPVKPSESTEEDTDEETLALRAAGPPQDIIAQRTLEAYKELEEENEHMHEDLKRVTGELKRMQDAYGTLKKQLSTPAPPAVDQEEVQELEDELSSLKSQLTEEQDKNIRLIEKMKKIRKKAGIQSESGVDSGEDSWNDSDEELFDSSTARKPLVVDQKPQTLMLLQNQVTQLRQDNKHLRERLQSNGSSISRLFGFRTGSVSSLASLDDMSEVERLRRKLEEMEADRQKLSKQLQDNNVFPEEQVQNMQVLEEENTKLHKELKQLRSENSTLKQNMAKNKENSHGSSSDLEKSEESAIKNEVVDHVESLPVNLKIQEIEEIDKENHAIKAENALLNEELEALRETYSKLVVAGDNLQEDFDQIVVEKQQLQKDLEESENLKQQLAKENEYLLADGMSMHADIDKLVAENEKLQTQNLSLLEDNEELERKVTALNHTGGKASEIAKIVEERDKLLEKNSELSQMAEELKQNHDIVLEEVQSLQTGCQRAEYERDQIQQEFDSLQDEFENVQISQEGLQQDYSQLEQDYSDLLADKEKLEQEFMEVQTASVNVENHNPAVAEERDKLRQDISDIALEKEQLEMTMAELSKSNALLNEELSRLKESLNMIEENSVKHEQKSLKATVLKLDSETKVDKKEVTANGDSRSASGSVSGESQDGSSIDTVVEKDRRIRSLQIQISRLQQQLADSDRHFRDVISTYRTHLLSAVQGHMDPDVKQALYNIIELRSMEQFC